MQLHPDTSIVKSNVDATQERVTSQGTLRNTSAISVVSRVSEEAWDSFPINAQRYLYHLRQHWKKPHDIEQHEIEEWRKNPEFSAFEDMLRSKEATLVLAKARLRERLPEVAMAIVDRALNPTARDSQRAGETILEANGIGTKHQVSTTSDVMLEFKRKIMTERGELTVTERLSVTDTKSQGDSVA